MMKSVLATAAASTALVLSGASSANVEADLEAGAVFTSRNDMGAAPSGQAVSS
jgi:hypothetical protein